MKIYCYENRAVVEISDAQYDFLQAMMKHSGRMVDVKKDYPITDEQIADWKADPIFSLVLKGYEAALFKSRGLTPEFVKKEIMETLEGTEKTFEQCRAVANAIKALGMGLTPRTGFGGKITVAPENTTITFNDGLDGQN